MGVSRCTGFVDVAREASSLRLELVLVSKYPPGARRLGVF
jgi:hypothetical protein